MTKKGIALVSIGSVFALALVGVLSFVGFSNYYHPSSGNIEVIEISQENMTGSFEYNFGIIVPGESKEQKIQVNSSAVLNLDYEISINGEDQLAYQYIDISAKVEGENIYSSLLSGCVNKGTLFTRSLAPTSKEEITFSYALKNDVPEDIVGQEVTFEITFSASLLS